MAREPVAIDFIGLGERGHVGMMGSSTHGGGSIDEERVSRVATRLVRPVPSVPDYDPHQTQAVSRMSSPASEGFRNWTDSTIADHVKAAATSNSFFTRPGAAGMCPPPWMSKHALAMRQIQEQGSGLTAEVSKGHSVGHSPSWDSLHSSAPASPSHPTFESFAQQLAQQARKAASMYIDPQLRNNVLMRTSSMGDEAHSNLSSGEPSFVSHPHPSSSTQSAAFGSPVPLPKYSRMKPGNITGNLENGAAIPQQQHQQEAAQEVKMAAAHAHERPPATGKQIQTAQLTIFYSGMVNVYDEVPYDNAQAIMLLAGKENTLSSDYMNVFGNKCGPASGRPVAGRPVATVPSAVSQPPSRAGSPAPQVTSTTSVGAGPPQGPAQTVVSNRATPTITGVELPQARKASLARFLERRKDRVRRPYTHRNNELATHEARMRFNNHENSPSPSSSSRLARQSPSRPEAGNNLSYNAGNRQAGASGTASEPNSPKLPSPPRHRSTSQERPNTGVVPGGSPDINPAALSSPSRHTVAMETERSSR